MKVSNQTFKSILFLLFLAICNLQYSVKAQQFDHTHSSYDKILSQSVIKGLVDYAVLKSDPTELNNYLDMMASITEDQFGSWNTNQKLAFLINMYNATTMKLILDHYPLKSIRDIQNKSKGPWDLTIVRLFKKNITLNQLEHGILRKQYNEPRLHVALVCAAKGCPALRNEAYTAKGLYKQLDSQAKQFLTNPMNMKIDRMQNTVHLSSIFEWYGEDFVPKYTPKSGYDGLNQIEKAVANYCSQYLSKVDQDYLKAGRYNINYLDYDWSLNDKDTLKK